MTLREILRLYPRMFYPQTWYLSEPFLDIDVEIDALHTVPTLVALPHPPRQQDIAPAAAQLAAMYIRHPDHSMWQQYLWCAESDLLGQRVYVGSNGQGLEIHRHIHLTERFMLPLWV